MGVNEVSHDPDNKNKISMAFEMQMAAQKLTDTGPAESGGLKRIFQYHFKGYYIFFFNTLLRGACEIRY
jgi:hypothetical protein